jgi:hypothetical protein
MEASNENNDIDAQFGAEGAEIYGQSQSVELHKKFFFLSPRDCTLLWIQLTNDPEPRHLLWTLLFMKQYNKVEILSSMVGAAKEEFWCIVAPLLDQISKLSRQEFCNGTLFAAVTCPLPNLPEDAIDFVNYYCVSKGCHAVRYLVGFFDGKPVWNGGQCPGSHTFDCMVGNEMPDTDPLYLKEDHQVVADLCSSWECLKKPFSQGLRKHEVVFNAVMAVSNFSVYIVADH